MNRILVLFRERETRDELGVGVIRDLVADELFPGTRTIHPGCPTVVQRGKWVEARVTLGRCVIGADSCPRSL